MPINPKQNGLATLWLVIIGFVLIAGSGYWYYVDYKRSDAGRKNYGSKIECEIKTFKLCMPILCGYKCPADFKIIWLPVGLPLPATPSVPYVENEEWMRQQEAKRLEAEIATWKTYRNEEYGFEFKYPSDWMINNNSSTYIILGNYSNDQISVEARKLQTGQNLETETKYIGLSKTQKILVDNSTALRGQSIGGEGDDSFTDLVFVEHSGTLFVVSGGDVKNTQSILNNMLSTFKFLK
ncbi:hypothetical protein A2662_00305 [Candidatus Giovannonibacteria bacterium RIFCSPHIGHO2_01_FULL_45_33]|uniref:Uncharacterized protein n=1 Tax=Candidatus Giovannonibacteria bacterium RIFCSPLOWO2_01_FULL_45_34 TaxID=1798351 RepID=A0A1F5X101_9BACT|nr:MAG: hypothetical protein A2662_00305 [Candidatus Giovannonibacteria bacterium RIFCSPHIGHO2_01_FULL_45_33]OGF70624.1 MAG: hypothetical protein A3C73_02385 [Candidatus Giovannonibacteria bacterium RIFCSPHIGHO2_02_FULL_44_11]OGF81523.1 MAG: hypothetical protein A2930_03815 [Candidatus Giovannonibacteria bacterium RIFCSPLOWO2_01_FULL_45_34]